MPLDIIVIARLNSALMSYPLFSKLMLLRRIPDAHIVSAVQIFQKYHHASSLVRLKSRFQLVTQRECLDDVHRKFPV